MPQAEVSDTEVIVSGFGFTKPKQWKTLQDRLKSPRKMRVDSADRAVIYLEPDALSTSEVVRILAESGFEVSHA